jgi:DNA-binding IclR family transcriptional regulator
MGLSGATPPRKRHLGPKASRALEFLANRPSGVAEALMLARGFSRRMLLGLVREGLVTLRAGGKMQITAAGRSAIEG